MRIEQDFPFDICETCCECVLDVEEKVLFSDNDICQKSLLFGARMMSCARD